MSKLRFIQTDKHSSLNDSLLQAGMLILEFDFILCASIVMVMLKSGTLWLSSPKGKARCMQIYSYSTVIVMLGERRCLLNHVSGGASGDRWGDGG